ncbi:DUF559 domain-containing protein [Natronospira bacteriovora]|uniref:DUF559 domain-containing protein n=1 Tax=Natronospira bacteriovora TaxID=3069753 RepID=A0ABU0W4L9_9GAMM|nr:DUF559 domain-containing protein [Natronospira sp. AB-CW4]MDQ2068941.1 DUF559 domain-containing protein [Natronospira sp. AB-CW4]
MKGEKGNMNIQTTTQTRLPASAAIREDAEKKLWKRLCHHQLGVSFRKRTAVGRDKQDFFSPEAALVICIDDEGINCEQQQNEDARLRRFGLETLRFSEQEVLFDTDRVVVEIFRNTLNRTARSEKRSNG